MKWIVNKLYYISKLTDNLPLNPGIDILVEPDNNTGSVLEVSGKEKVVMSVLIIAQCCVQCWESFYLLT